MLRVSDLSVSVNNKSIISDLALTMEPGSVHIIMGPNGSGKSTLALSLMGHPSCTITKGHIMLQGQPLNEITADKRAAAGLFLAFQYPYEIPGLPIFTLLKEAHWALTKQTVPTAEFQAMVFAAFDAVSLDRLALQRPLSGFSGGEKKKLEVVQLLLLKPKIAILDEIDSGLDIDALKIVADSLKAIRAENPQLSMLFITHNPRLTQYITPDCVHIMQNGTFIKSGSADIMNDVELQGFTLHG